MLRAKRQAESALLSMVAGSELNELGMSKNQTSLKRPRQHPFSFTCRYGLLDNNLEIDPFPAIRQ